MKIDEQDFSAKLRLHASSLDLDQLAPVSDWTYGQSIRRAKDKRFFYDLSSAHFYPLGLNHPLSLQNQSFDNSPQDLTAHLQQSFPHLKDYKWSVVSGENYLKFNKHRTHLLLPSFIITSSWGIQEFENSQLEEFAIKIPDGSHFLCSKHSLPLSDLTTHHGWIRLFLSPEIIGKSGRLIQIQNLLSAIPQFSQVIGLCLQVNVSSKVLAQSGVKVDVINDNTTKLCFPVSVLRGDIQKIAEIVEQLERLHAHS